jgi:hypothetical protein
MTLNEICYNILNLYRGGRSSNNEQIPLRQIAFNVKHHRATLLRRDFERNGLISRHAEQEIRCMRLVPVDASRCCGLPVGCKVMLTEQPIPRTIRFSHQEAITAVSDVTGIHSIPVVPLNTVQLLPFDRFTKAETKAFMLGDHLGLYEPDGRDRVNIRGIFEDPEELSLLDCDGASCYDPDMDFPMPMDLVDAVTRGIVEGTLKLLPLTVSDTTNDTMQDAADVGKK